VQAAAVPARARLEHPNLLRRLGLPVLCAPPPRLLALYHHNKNQGSDWDPPTFPVVVGSSERAWVSLERMHALLCLCILAAPPPPLTQSRGGAGRGGAADLPAFCPGDLGTTSGT
jgi:hypothetical protein